jgi:hypothetical protein
MKEDVFEKPLVMKDFVKGRRKKNTKKDQKGRLYERVRKAPESKRSTRQSKYSELVNSIAKERRGTYKVLLDSIKVDLLPKTAYPSIERLIMQIAKRDGVDFSIVIRRPVQTKKGIRTNVSYSEFVKWKEDNLKLRLINNELFIEKKTDRPL